MMFGQGAAPNVYFARRRKGASVATKFSVRCCLLALKSNNTHFFV